MLPGQNEYKDLYEFDTPVVRALLLFSRPIPRFMSIHWFTNVRVAPSASRPACLSHIL